MRNLFLFCFIILLGTQANAQELRQLRVTGKAKKLDGEMVARRDINGDYAAAIQIITNLEGLSYDSWDGMVGDVEAKPGQDMVFVTHRERVLEIYALGYQKLQVTLSELGIHLKPREVWQITVTGDAPPAATLPVTIRVTPADATLSIDGKPTGKTGTHSLAPGNHTLKMEKEGYKTEEKTITVSEQQVFFEYALQRKPDAGLQIETTPAGATVYLDGVSLGQSPVAAFYKPGTYPIRIVKEGYVTIENQTLEVALPQTRKSYTLEENVGWLTINTHSGASVFFNDQIIPSPKNVKLAPQLIKVKVTMPKAEPLEQQVILKRNDRLTFDMFPTVQTGTIQIAVTPFDANIELSGDAGEKFTAVGMKIFEDIPVGTYTVKVSALGYDPAQETVNLKIGEIQNKTFRLSEAIKTAANPPASTSNSKTGNLKIGDKAHGGIVFYLDGKGGGLVCAEKDQGTAPWGCYGKSIVGTFSGIGTGAENTGKIIKNCSDENTAARTCNNLVLNGYSDWFLPSKDELNLIYKNLKSAGIGEYEVSYYWSSSEGDSDGAWSQTFYNGYQSGSSKYSYELVRAIRAFYVHDDKDLKNRNELRTYQPSITTDRDIEMVFVKGGTFTMGCTSEQSDCDNEEKPTRRVTISDFYIGKYEVTQKQWVDIMGSNPSYFKGCDDCPVESVSWNDIQEFIKKLNQKTGKKYRLPTEAEWEYAAHGGVNGSFTKYAGSNNIDEVAWYNDNSSSKTHSVGINKPNELNIYDMSGNVWEWCSDWYGKYSIENQIDPQGPFTGNVKILRGGSWGNMKEACEIITRDFFGPSGRYDFFGFRLALSSN